MYEVTTQAAPFYLLCPPEFEPQVRVPRTVRHLPYGNDISCRNYILCLAEVLVPVLLNIISSLCTVEVLPVTIFVLQNFPAQEKVKQQEYGVHINLLATDFFFQILAHAVFKM